jgi:uncharacterized protein involved in outer membrane biogenesis
LPRRTHRALRIAAYAAAALLPIAAGIIGYAAYNLNAVIAYNHNRILARVSNALGRPVKVGAIKARFGLGLSIEIDGLAIADDPAFGRDPFFSAAQASLDVRFVPLLHGKVKVVRLELSQPIIRVLRRADGKLNLDTLGQFAAAGANATRHGAANAMRGVVWAVAREVSIKALKIDDGTLYYHNASSAGVPLQVTHLSVDLNGIHTGSAFDVDVKSALFSDQPNLEVSGKMGPMMRNGMLDVPSAALDLKFKAGPVSIDRLRTLLAPGELIPVTLSMPDPLTSAGSVKGTLANSQLAASAIFSAYHIIYQAASNKPGSAPLKLDLSGNTTVQGSIHPLNLNSGWDLSATMSGIASRFEGAQLPAITNFDGRIHLTPTRIELQPATFTLGSGKASLQASADSLNPLRAAFDFKADTLQLSQIVPSRPPGEFVNQLAVSGKARGQMPAPVINARITSASGLVERLAYSNLDVTGSYADNRVSAQPLSVNVFNGSVLANVNAVMAPRPPFNASASLRHINVTEASRWLDLGTNALTGYLTTDVRMSGAGMSWQEIQPTLRGDGRMYLSSGQLHGINIVAVALNKIAAAPVVSQLVSVAFRTSHQGLFTSSSTDLSQTSMSFTLDRQRVTTNDLLVQTPNYQITGAGWFDFDKNIDMAGDIKLPLGISAAIPVMVMGKYPDLLVLPNIPKLAERAAIGVVNAPVNIIKGGANAVGSVMGGIRSILP